MKQKFSHIIQKISSATMFVSMFVLLFPSGAFAMSPIEKGIMAARIEGMPTDLLGADGFVTRLINTLLFAVGTLSVLMIVAGGIRYVASGGKDASVTKAKNTILYAVIGLIVSLLAYSAVKFVIDTVAPGVGNSWTNI